VNLTSFDRQILALCLSRRPVREIVVNLGAQSSLGLLALLYNRIGYLCWAQVLRRAHAQESGSLHRTTLLEVDTRRWFGAEPSTIRALLAVLASTPRTTTQIARLARTHDDTARRALPRLARLGLVAHSRATDCKYAPHLWSTPDPQPRGTP